MDHFLSSSNIFLFIKRSTSIILSSSDIVVKTFFFLYANNLRCDSHKKDQKLDTIDENEIQVYSV